MLLLEQTKTRIYRISNIHETWRGSSNNYACPPNMKYEKSYWLQMHIHRLTWNTKCSVNNDYRLKLFRGVCFSNLTKTKIKQMGVDVHPNLVWCFYKVQKTHHNMMYHTKTNHLHNWGTHQANGSFFSTGGGGVLP